MPFFHWGTCFFPLPDAILIIEISPLDGGERYDPYEKAVMSFTCFRYAVHMQRLYDCDQALHGA